MSNPTFVERELRRHAVALRALARDLVGPGHADDVVQEAAVRALRSPPASLASLRAWLAMLVRNVARNHHRATARRGRRERLSARPEALPSAGALAERRELLQRVTAAVTALPEPYQTTVLLRYYEGLSPSAIAARTRTPLPTVKSRLQRALARLAQELDGRSGRGDWRRALIAAAAWPAPALRPSAITCAVMTKLSKPLVAVAALLILGAIALVWIDRAAGLGAPGEGGEPRAGLGRPLVAAAPAAPTAEDRREVDPRSVGGIELAHVHRFELDCRVIDRDGLPVEGATLLLAPAGAALNTWPQTTDPHGRVTLAWKARSPRLRVVVAVRYAAISQPMRELELFAGRPAATVLLGEPGSAVAGAPIDPCPGARAASCATCHADGEPPRGVFDERLRLRAGLHPSASFADRLSPPAIAVTVRGEGRHPIRDLARRSEASRAAPMPGAVVRGRIVDSSGRPAAGVTVACGPAERAPVVRGRTRDDGSFTLSGVPPRALELFAGGGAAGATRTPLDVPASGSVHVELVLDPGHRIAGRVAWPASGTQPDAVVEYVADDGSWVDATSVASDGRFELANLPPGGGTLLLLPGRVGGLPLAILRGVQVDDLQVEFDLGTAAAAGGSIRLRAARTATSAPSFELRIWQRDSGRGALARELLRGTPGLGVGDLPPGFYRVELLADAVGTLELGEIWVDGSTPSDLGTIRLPEPGFVRWQIDAAAPPESIELHRRSADGDLRAEGPIVPGRQTELPLPAGEWLCLWRDRADAAVRATTFTVEPRRTTLVDLR